MDGLNDIHLLPDSTNKIRGEGGGGSLYGVSVLWGGETVWCPTQTLVHPTYICQNLNSRCLVWRIDGDEFSPVSWLIWCCRGAAVADMDCIGATVVAKVWGLVRLVVYAPASTLPFPPPSFLILQITRSCGNFNTDRKEGRKVTVRSHKVLLTKFTQRHCVLQDQDRVSACRLLCRRKQKNY